MTATTKPATPDRDKLPTKGQRALADATTTKPAKVPRRAIAAALGVSIQTVGEWVRGNSRPTAIHMAKLEDLGICSMRAWTEDDSSPLPLEGANDDDDGG